MSHDQSSHEPARNESDATTYVGIAMRWWWLLVAALLGGALAGYVASGFMTPTYQASATLLVSQQEIPGVTQRDDVETSAMLSNTFTRLLTLGPVMTRAIDLGGLNITAAEFQESIQVENAATSPIIDITATNTSPALARDMVNVLAQVFIVSPELELAGGAGAVTIVAPATLPTEPVSPRPALNAILGGALAFIVALLLAVLFEHLREQRAIRAAAHVTKPTAIRTANPGVPAVYAAPATPGALAAPSTPPASESASLPATDRHGEPRIEAQESAGIR